MAAVDWEQKRREVEHVRSMLVTAERAADAATVVAKTVMPGAVDGFAHDAARTLRDAIEIVDATLKAMTDKTAAEPQPSGDAS